MLAIPSDMADADTESLNRMRNRVLYEGYKNPIVEWTLSPQWQTIPSYLKIRGDVTFKSRSFKTVCDTDVVCGEICGEIQARTCGCTSCR